MDGLFVAGITEREKASDLNPWFKKHSQVSPAGQHATLGSDHDGTRIS